MSVLCKENSGKKISRTLKRKYRERIQEFWGKIKSCEKGKTKGKKKKREVLNKQPKSRVLQRRTNQKPKKIKQKNLREEGGPWDEMGHNAINLRTRRKRALFS